MKDILIIIMSALLGYIVLSAFSVGTPDEAMKRLIQQPQTNRIEQQELEREKVEKEQEIKLAQLENDKKLKELEIQQNIAITTEKYNTDIKIKEIDSQASTNLAGMKYNSLDNQKESDNKMLIIISLFIFILIYVFLRYQKNLAQEELEREREHNNLLAKKEYAERILAIVANGNVSIETEHKLLKILDELNNPQLQSINHNAELGHPNPDIEQLEFRRTI
ncbi:MAG: hypothetical protein KAG56_07800 [Sulfurovaceae bacterium]|nr:hypothetical protein [Sulfurovaceae bacterium]